MDVEKEARVNLEEIAADRRLVDEMSSHGLITQAARDHALQLLYPHKNWGLWISRLLLVVGSSLVLAGIVYFFAFNWAKLAPAIKLGSLELGIAGCLAAAFLRDLNKLGGKILLLSASVLVGVFLAVFGQIYQTGADAYNLFMMWAALIAGWVVFSEFAALWAVWLVVCNVFLVLGWYQDFSNGWDLAGTRMDFALMPILALFNLAFLAAREYFVARGAVWLADKWTRLILIVPILIILLIPTLTFIFDPSQATAYIITGSVLSAAVHAGMFAAYRYKFRDMWSLAAVVLSTCIIFEAAGIKFLDENLHDHNAALLLIGGIMTIGLFTSAIVVLRRISKNLGEDHV